MKLNLSDMGNWAQIVSVPLMIFLWYFTKEKFAEFWKRWQKTFFGLCVIAVLIVIWERGWLAWLWRPVALPVWILILIGTGGLLVGFLVRSLHVVISSPAAESSHSIDWRNYVNDEIFGVRWQWGYYRNRIDDELSAFCPRQNCKCRLDQQMNLTTPYTDNGVPVSLVCPHCGFRQDFEHDYQSLKQRVLVEIERRINTGEYQKQISLS